MNYSLFRKLTSIILIVLTIVSGILIVQILTDFYRFLIFPYQNEIRQVAFMPLVNGLVDFKDWFTNNQSPQNLYVYGFFYPLIIKLFPISDKLLVSKLVTVFSLLGSCILLVRIYLKVSPRESSSAKWLMIPLAATFLISGYKASLSSSPTALGQFLFLISILIPLIDRSKRALWISAIAGVCAFYSKPYFALALPFAAASLFLFDSKRRAITLFNIATPVFLLTAVLIHLFWDGYFNRTFFTHIGYPVLGKWSHLKFQVVHLIELEWLVILLVIFAAFIRIVKSRIELNLKDFDKPIIESGKTVFDSAFLVTALGTCFFLYSMGKHVGSSYGHYYYHLTFPFIILMLFIFPQKSERITSAFRILMIVYFILAFNRYQSNKNLEELKIHNDQLEVFLSQFDNVLNTANVAGILYNQEKQVYDNGNMEYYYDGRNHVFGNYKEYVHSYSRFNNNIMDQIKNSEFDLLMNNPNSGPYTLLGNSRKENYRLYGKVLVRNPVSETLEYLWIRKDETKKIQIPQGLDITRHTKN